MLTGIAVMVFAVRGAYPFLAVNDPLNNGALVVEGWVPDYALQQAIAEFKQDHYRKIYVTGGPLGTGSYLAEYKNFAELGAATLVRLGLETNSLEAVPAPKVRLDRTFASALALRKWLDQQRATETNFTVMSMGAHARRSRLLFEKALGKGCRVGIIAVEDQDYDSKRWWTSSEGVRGVTGEVIAYLYAKLSS